MQTTAITIGLYCSPQGTSKQRHCLPPILDYELGAYSRQKVALLQLLKTNTMTLSFRQAFQAKESGAISWDESIHNLLARCGGIKHEEDNDPYDNPDLLEIDPLSHSIWTWAKKNKAVEGSYSA